MKNSSKVLITEQVEILTATAAFSDQKDPSRAARFGSCCSSIEEHQERRSLATFVQSLQEACDDFRSRENDQGNGQ